MKAGVSVEKIRTKFSQYRCQQIAGVLAHKTLGTYKKKKNSAIAPEDRKQIIIMARKGMKADAIAKSLPQYKQIQIMGVKAHVTLGTYD